MPDASLDRNEMDDQHPERRRGLLYGRSQSHPLSVRQQSLMDELLPKLSLLASPPHPIRLHSISGLPEIDIKGAQVDQARLASGRGSRVGDLSAHDSLSPWGEGQGEGGSPPLNLNALFGPAIEDYAIEIGFGGGEHLRAQAKANPARGFIGCEPFVNGMAQMLAHIEDEGLTNIRLHHGDAREVLERLPDASLAAAYVLFPDPWPKKRHWKRRFVGPQTVPLLARVLKPGATFRVASDIADYVRWSLIHVVPSGLFDWTATGPDDWRIRPPDWPPTRYEAKALKAGRTPAYLHFERSGPP